MTNTFELRRLRPSHPNHPSHQAFAQAIQTETNHEIVTSRRSGPCDLRDGGLRRTPTKSQFVEKAGASDTFEIDSARLMVTSKNPAIKTFATQMLTDHTKSTKMVQAAAKADHVALKKPSMSVGQRTDLTALKAVPAGKTKDDLYVKQQKAAHDDALALMQDYGANGSAPHLKSAAEKIAPVVEKHQSMLASM